MSSFQVVIPENEAEIKETLKKSGKRNMDPTRRKVIGIIIRMEKQCNLWTMKFIVKQAILAVLAEDCVVYDGKINHKFWWPNF